LQVDDGAVDLNADLGVAATTMTAAKKNVELVLADGSITLGSNQVLGGLDVQKAASGDQTLDLNDHVMRVYTTGSLTGLEADINAMLALLGDDDGITDSTAASNMAVGVTDQLVDAHGDPMVFVAITLLGDADMDG